MVSWGNYPNARYSLWWPLCHNWWPTYFHFLCMCFSISIIHFFWWVGIEAFTASSLQTCILNLSIFVQRFSLAWAWTFVSLSCPLVPPEDAWRHVGWQAADVDVLPATRQRNGRAWDTCMYENMRMCGCHICLPVFISAMFLSAARNCAILFDRGFLRFHLVWPQTAIRPSSTHRLPAWGV